MSIRSIETTNTVALCEWARYHGKNGPYALTPVQRYGVGIYQIGQGMKWSGHRGRGPRYESYAAACIHFLIATEILDVCVEQYLPVDLTAIECGTFGYTGWEHLMLHITSAQQMICYSMHRNDKAVKWKSRYKPDILAESIAGAIKLLISLVPEQSRARAFQEAMEEMLPKAFSI